MGKSKQPLSLWSWIRYRSLTGLCWLVGLLPTWLLYHCLLDAIYFFLYKVFGYRLPVVRDNLRRSFPEKGDEELKRIEKGFYYHLSEVFVDTIDLVGISRRSFEKRISFVDMEKHEREVAGRNWIAALAHYGSWEYFTAYQFYTASQVAGVYRPLHNKAFDAFYLRARSRFGLRPVPMKEVVRYLAQHGNDERKTALGLIADQNPAGYDIEHWFDFLGRRTAFMPGIEKIAVKFNMPVYFMRLRKLGRRCYEAGFERIYDGVEQLPRFEIMTRYVSRLELMIEERPELWMWSHRRWKQKPPEVV